MSNQHTKLREKIYATLLAGDRTVAELASLTDAPAQQVSNQIKRLREYGMVRLAGAKKSAPVWGAVKRPKPRHENNFEPGDFDYRQFSQTVRGTPWQGIEVFVA